MRVFSDSLQEIIFNSSFIDCWHQHFCNEWEHHYRRHLPSIFHFADRNGKPAVFWCSERQNVSVCISSGVFSGAKMKYWSGLCRRLPADGRRESGCFSLLTHQTSKLLHVFFSFFFNEKATGATPQSLEISSVSRLPPNGTNGGSDKKKMNNTSQTFHLHTPTASQSSLVGSFLFFSFVFFFILSYFLLQSVCETSQGHERKVLEITPGVDVKREKDVE